MLHFTLFFRDSVSIYPSNPQGTVASTRHTQSSFSTRPTFRLFFSLVSLTLYYLVTNKILQGYLATLTFLMKLAQTQLELELGKFH
jgi:hypothetical protein